MVGAKQRYRKTVGLPIKTYASASIWRSKREASSLALFLARTTAASARMFSFCCLVFTSPRRVCICNTRSDETRLLNTCNSKTHNIHLNILSCRLFGSAAFFCSSKPAHDERDRGFGFDTMASVQAALSGTKRGKNYCSEMATSLKSR
jgi:hypothetical protein